MRSRIDAVLFGVAWMVVVVGLASFAGAVSRYAELLSHFRPHQAVLAALFTLLLLWRRKFKTAGLLALMTLAHTVPLGPYLIPTNRVTEGLEIRILSSNVLTANSQYGAVLDLIEHERPDLLMLQETSQAWLDQLAPLTTTHPHRLAVPRDDNFGIAIYSRWPLEEPRILDHDAFGIPSLIAAIQIQGQRIALLVTHPPPPISPRHYQARNAQLSDLTEVLRQVAGPWIVAGDFNATPWSADYQRFEHRTGLRNVRRGFGLLPTWPSPLLTVGIPIDHVLVSPDFAVADAKIGPDVGSDHRPVIATLTLTPADARPP